MVLVKTAAVVTAAAPVFADQGAENIGHIILLDGRDLEGQLDDLFQVTGTLHETLLASFAIIYWSLCGLLFPHAIEEGS